MYHDPYRIVSYHIVSRYDMIRGAYEKPLELSAVGRRLRVRVRHEYAPRTWQTGPAPGVFVTTSQAANEPCWNATKKDGALVYYSPVNKVSLQ
jgi:hypothetical protein